MLKELYFTSPSIEEKALRLTSLEIANGGRKWILDRVRLRDDGHRPGHVHKDQMEGGFGKFSI